MNFLIILVVSIYLTTIILTFVNNDPEVTSKIETINQLTYTFVTTILVLLTFKALKTTREQRHETVRPYLEIREFDMWEEKGNTKFDLELVNSGMESALNIRVLLKKAIDKTIVYEEFFPKLSKIGNHGIEGGLCDIANVLGSGLSKQGSSFKFQFYYPAINIEDVNLESGIEKYYNLNLEIDFSNIYGKKYKLIFDLRYNQEEREFNQTAETFMEL